MDRRTYLSLAALATIPLAGCADSTETDDGGDGSSTDSDGTTDDTNGDGSTGGDGSGDGDGGGDSTDDSDGDDDTDGQSDGTDGGGGSEPTELSSIASVDYNEPQPDTFSGTGTELTDSVTMDAGLLIADFEHDGESNFIVELWDDTIDERHDYLANEIGSVNGLSATGVPGGEFSLDVDADGDWDITLAQPITDPADAHQAPATASGDGNAVVGPVDFQGSVDVTGSHSGDSNFIVHLWTETATSTFNSTVVFNEIGSVDDAETRVSHEGLSWVVVNANGDWELSFE